MMGAWPKVNVLHVATDHDMPLKISALELEVIRFVIPINIPSIILNFDNMHCIHVNTHAYNYSA